MNILKFFQDKRSIRKKLIFTTSIIILITNIFIIQVVNVELRSKFQEYMISTNEQRMHQTVDNLNAIMTQIIESALPIYSEITKEIGASEKALEKSGPFAVKFAHYYSDLIDSIQSFSYIHSILLLTEKGNNYFESYNNNKYTLGENIYEKLLEEVDPKGIATWTNVFNESFYYTNSSEQEIVSLVFPVKKNYKIVSLFVVNIEVEKMVRFLEKAEEGDRLILQIGNRSIMTDSAWIDDTDLNDVLNNCERNDLEETNNYYIFTNRITTGLWRFSLVYDKENIKQNVYESLSNLLVIIILIGLVMIFLNYYIIKNITNPIEQLTGEIRKSEQQGVLRKFELKGGDGNEVGVLVNAYNMLIVTINEMMINIEEEQKASSKAYLQALQMQINPHFLYNTLGNLRYLVELQDPRATQMIIALGDFYKFTLISSEDETDLESEMKHVDSYLQIMKLRYGSKFDYEVRQNELLNNNAIIKMALQPLVENAIYHGIKTKHGKSRLIVQAFARTDCVEVVVYDDGLGIEQTVVEKLNYELSQMIKIKKGEHIGLQNVNQRIKIHFGKQYGLHIESKYNEYTKVTLILPIKEFKEAQNGTI